MLDTSTLFTLMTTPALCLVMTSFVVRFLESHAADKL